jgi:peroxiredoxin
VSLGYTNVKRYPAGYMGWLEAYPEAVVSTADEQKPPPLGPGDPFPSCNLVVLENGNDREYLGLPPDAEEFSLEDVRAEYVFVEFFNSLCSTCLEELHRFNRLYRLVQKDPVLSDKLRMIGLGVGNSRHEVAAFRHKQKTLFPLFSDKNGDVFSCLGRSTLPASYLVRRVDGDGREIVLTLKDEAHPGDPEKVFELLKGAIRRD